MARNLPNPVDERSPIIFQSKDNAISTGDADDTYSLEHRIRIHVEVGAGSVEIKFYDSDSNKIGKSLNLDSNDSAWEYDFGLKQSTPAEIRVSANQDSSNYDIRGERV